MPEIHLDPTGSTPKAKTPSPKTIKAQSDARDSFAKTLFGGLILSVLAVAYLVALFKGIDADKILVLLGTGLGFLLGKNTPPNNEA
jgi:hypothetical protein